MPCAGSPMMNRSSKTRPGLLVCSGLRSGSGKSRRAKAHAQIHAAVVAERRDGLARLRVDGREIAAGHVEQPLILAVGTAPVVEPAGAHRAGVGPAPHLGAGGRVQCHQVVGARQHEDQAVSDERAEHEVPVPAGERPRHLQLRHRLAVDLREGRGTGPNRRCPGTRSIPCGTAPAALPEPRDCARGVTRAATVIATARETTAVDVRMRLPRPNDDVQEAGFGPGRTPATFNWIL